MADERPERPRWFQFGLRRLLFWTTLVAIFLGLGSFWAASQRIYSDATFACSLAAIAVVAAILRALIRPWIAWHLTTFIAGFIYAINPGWWFWSEPLGVPLDATEQLALFTTHFVIHGFGVGWVIFLVVDGVCRVVDWSDRFIEKKMRAASDDR